MLVRRWQLYILPLDLSGSLILVAVSMAACRRRSAIFPRLIIDMITARCNVHDKEEPKGTLLIYRDLNMRRRHLVLVISRSVSELYFEYMCSTTSSSY